MHRIRGKRGKNITAYGAGTVIYKLAVTWVQIDLCIFCMHVVKILITWDKRIITISIGTGMI